MNKRYQFKVNIDNDFEVHRKYGKDPVDALFRYQLDILRSEIDPKVFRTKKRKSVSKT
jgi:hypothetical protein